MARVSKAYLPDDETFCQLVACTDTMSDLCRTLGYAGNSGNMAAATQRRIKELGLSVVHHDPLANTQRIPLEEILVEDSFYQNVPRLKERMLAEGLLEYECDLCGNQGLWNGFPITLQLDHINGRNNDHRRSNLRLLCPNCHSQTITYAGNNVGF